MDNSMSKKKRVDLFRRLLEKTNIIEPDDVEIVINQNLANNPFTPMPQPTPIATSNPFSALIEEPEP